MVVLIAAAATAKSLRGEDDVVVVFDRVERSPKGPIPKGNNGNNRNKGKGSNNKVRNSNTRTFGSGSKSVSIEEVHCISVIYITRFCPAKIDHPRD